MSKRKRKRKRSAGRRPGIWIAGAALGALVTYFFFTYRGSQPGAIPLPGVSSARSPGEPPHEQIHDSERQALDRVLRDHAR